MQKYSLGINPELWWDDELCFVFSGKSSWSDAFRLQDKECSWYFTICHWTQPLRTKLKLVYQRHNILIPQAFFYGNTDYGCHIQKNLKIINHIDLVLSVTNLMSKWEGKGYVWRRDHNYVYLLNVSLSINVLSFVTFLTAFSNLNGVFIVRGALSIAVYFPSRKHRFNLDHR